MSDFAADRLPTLKSASEAHALLHRISDTMDTLISLLETETQLLKAGQLMQASQLQPDKARLASQFVRDFEIIRCNSAILKNDAAHLLEPLKLRYDSFRAHLQINMAVLETAKALSQSLVSDMADIVARQDKPLSYGYNGRNQTTTAASPVSLSKNL